MNNLNKIVLCIALIVTIVTGTVVFSAINYIESQNKITGDMISTTIRVEGSELLHDSYGFNYLAIVDERDRGYYTQIGPSAIPNIKIGEEYDLEYFCDTNNIRRIVTTTPHKITAYAKYKCEGTECQK